MGIANLSACLRCCYIFFHLVLQLLAILVVVIVILLLLSVLIKDIGIQCRANQLMFVCRASICRKMIWGLTARTSRMGYYGLGSSADRTVVCCTNVVIPWLARGTGRETSTRACRIRRRRLLFGKLQAWSLEEVINIVPSIEIGRSRSCRVNGSLWAIEKILVCCYTFGTETNIIDFGSRGTRVVTAQQHNWIFYAMLGKLVYFHGKE